MQMLLKKPKVMKHEEHGSIYVEKFYVNSDHGGMGDERMTSMGVKTCPTAPIPIKKFAPVPVLIMGFHSQFKSPWILADLCKNFKEIRKKERKIHETYS